MVAYQVDSERLLAAVVQTQGAVERVRAEAAALTAGLVALQDCWSGDASTSFQAVVQQWRGTQLTVEEQIGLITTALGAAGTSYDGAENDVRRMFGA
ncbi:WXG100 family type VII secretion target [Pseudoclavibacter chungangensis]|uniref:ESAT-6-like protein n=1 Tax=Pseudoclavibacter chungangensis TaxID=587635 RepID=A0A7J5C1R0_9MICO|nr:WXG100 family type VII secretion target [Pseudoclavibacter chungangensis]KAB1660365.1 WXG100 family type VII secretion target [Pseudoclavibacter chungangensis]NYJ65724.1 WXG100 family type VII secretion target [Pseudoclavibacter chungangensis]